MAILNPQFANVDPNELGVRGKRDSDPLPSPKFLQARPVMLIQKEPPPLRFEPESSGDVGRGERQVFEFTRLDLPDDLSIGMSANMSSTFYPGQKSADIQFLGPKQKPIALKSMFHTDGVQTAQSKAHYWKTIADGGIAGKLIYNLLGGVTEEILVVVEEYTYTIKNDSEIAYDLTFSVIKNVTHFPSTGSKTLLKKPNLGIDTLKNLPNQAAVFAKRFRSDLEDLPATITDKSLGLADVKRGPDGLEARAEDLVKGMPKDLVGKFKNIPNFIDKIKDFDRPLRVALSKSRRYTDTVNRQMRNIRTLATAPQRIAASVTSSLNDIKESWVDVQRTWDAIESFPKLTANSATAIQTSLEDLTSSESPATAGNIIQADRAKRLNNQVLSAIRFDMQAMSRQAEQTVSPPTASRIPTDAAQRALVDSGVIGLTEGELPTFLAPTRAGGSIPVGVLSTGTFIYTVVQGDTLPSISVAFTSSLENYKDIAKLNPETIASPILTQGQQLVLPANFVSVL